MSKNKNKQTNKYDIEDRTDIRKSYKLKRKNERKKDKKYLKDMLQGDIDKDTYHEYNDNER